jgi:PKD repeat protein
VTVTFSDTSAGTITSWLWNFGDTNMTTQQNPVNTYSAAGTYTVALTVTGPGGADGETKVDYIVITEPQPTAEFTGTPLSATSAPRPFRTRATSMTTRARTRSVSW